MSQKTPNIIMILTDDLGYGDLSCYGQKTWKTPNLDRMASEGIRFTDFYSTSPVCSPARTSVLTGLHSGHLPIRALPDPYLPDHIPTIPKLLKSNHYVSACIGKYGVGNNQPDVDPIRKGFDYHFGYNCMCHAHNYYPPFLRENGLRVPLRNRPPEGDTKQWETGIGVAELKVDYSPDLIEERALEFISDCKDQPFFLYYCPTLPHANNEGGESPDGMEVDTYGEFEEEDWAPNEKGFARMIQRIDISVGRIIETLKKLGLEENTLVMFSSDNGPHNEGGHNVTRFNSAGSFKGYKRSLNEGGIRVPFIAWQPGTLEPSLCSDMNYFPDLLPTICDWADITLTNVNHDGISMKQMLEGSPELQSQHEYLYFEYNNQIAVRQGPWKYFCNEDGVESLHNLEQDPHEDVDASADHQEIFLKLKSFISREHKEHLASPAPVHYDSKRCRASAPATLSEADSAQ